MKYTLPLTLVNSGRNPTFTKIRSQDNLPGPVGAATMTVAYASLRVVEVDNLLPHRRTVSSSCFDMYVATCMTVKRASSPSCFRGAATACSERRRCFLKARRLISWLWTTLSPSDSSEHESYSVDVLRSRHRSRRWSELDDSYARRNSPPCSGRRRGEMAAG
jgi:hypothetical protein